jgi:hypothetical protein
MKNIFSKFGILMRSPDFWVRMLFISLAASFWLLIKLSKTGYVDTIRYPVAYVNIPKNKLLVQPEGAQIAVRVNTVGFKILGFGRDIDEPLEIDVKRFSRSIEKGGTVYYWLPNLYHDEIEANLEAQTQLLRIDPDTLFFDMVDKVTKTVPVLFDANLTYAIGFGPYVQPRLTPEFIEVSGPANMLDTLTAVRTAPITLKNLNTEVLTELAVIVPNEQIEIESESVELHIDVAQFTEKQLLVPIAILNPPRGEQVGIHPYKVEVTVRVAVRDFDLVTEDKISVVCNLAQLREFPERKRLILEISSPLKNAEIVRASTHSVDYLRYKL